MAAQWSSRVNTMPENSAAKPITGPLLCCMGCYVIWGMQPVYWALLDKFSSMFVMCIRVIMAVFFMYLYLACTGRLKEVAALVKDRQKMKYIAPAALFLCADWTLFIWAVTNGHVLDATLGYYFNPLMIFLAGVLLVKEKAHVLEYAAVGIACVGIIMSIIQYGSFPLLFLCFAAVWPIYATIKRFAKADPIISFTIEVTIMLPFAIAAALVFFRGEGGFSPVSSAGDVMLLIVSGIVTALPMILYNMVVNALPFKMVGILQYAGTTITFLCGILFMHEAVTSNKLIMFSFIWAGLIVYTIGSFKKAGSAKKLK